MFALLRLLENIANTQKQKNNDNIPELLIIHVKILKISKKFEKNEWIRLNRLSLIERNIGHKTTKATDFSLLLNTLVVKICCCQLIS